MNSKIDLKYVVGLGKQRKIPISKPFMDFFTNYPDVL